MFYTGIYVVRIDALSVSAAKTLIQIKAGTSRALDLLHLWLSQTASETSEQLPVQVLRKSSAATVTSFTPLLYRPGDAAADAAGGTSATGTNASGEGTDTDILYSDAFNVLGGWVWTPIPETRPRVAAGGIIGLKLNAAPGAALTMSGGIIFGEVG